MTADAVLLVVFDAAPIFPAGSYLPRHRWLGEQPIRRVHRRAVGGPARTTAPATPAILFNSRALDGSSSSVPATTDAPAVQSRIFSVEAVQVARRRG